MKKRLCTEFLTQQKLLFCFAKHLQNEGAFAKKAAFLNSSAVNAAELYAEKNGSVYHNHCSTVVVRMDVLKDMGNQFFIKKTQSDQQ